MGLPGTMTTFTAGSLGRRITDHNGFVVRVAVKVEPNVGMAGLADVAPDIAAPSRLICRLSHTHKGNEEEYCNKAEPVSHCFRIVEAWRFICKSGVKNLAKIAADWGDPRW
jgi:hypothetical protein